MQNLNKYIEHTLLKSDATEKEIEKLVKEAFDNDFLGVCININYIKKVKYLLESMQSGNLNSSNLSSSDISSKLNKIKIVTVVNFPLASNSIDIIRYQTQKALELGADEIDTVLNIAEIKNKNYKKATDDIKKTKEICKNNNLKVILETDLLTKEEIVTACKCAIDGGADFVKTSTGFVKGGIGAKVEDVKLMYEAVNPYNLQVKASGGIKTALQAQELIKAGAVRLGTSSGVEIIKGV